jgi:hypothetical protein
MPQDGAGPSGAANIWSAQNELTASRLAIEKGAAVARTPRTIVGDGG